jgi:hypothetical protein
MFYENDELVEMNSVDRNRVVISELTLSLLGGSDQITVMSPVASVLMWR